MEHVYKIKDVWMALKISFNVFVITVTIYSVFSFIVLALAGASSEFIIDIEKALFVVAIVQAIIQYIKNSYYEIDMNTGKVLFPKTDIQNSIIDIVTLVPYWNLMYSKTIDASDIEGIYLDNNRYGDEQATGKYNISVVGKFGSAKLEFVDRQKRDEVRNALIQVVKKFKDDDLAFQVAEL